MDRPENIFFICVHKGASTFIASDLFPSLARRSPHLQLYYVGREYVDWFHDNSEKLKLNPTSNKTETTRRLKLMFAERPLPPAGGLVGRLYPNQIEALCHHLKDGFPPQKGRVFIMRRDPRDALVSMYYSKAFSHSERSMLTSVNRNVLGERRNKIKQMGIHRWIEKTLTNPRNLEVVDEFTNCARMLTEHPEITDLPYELLVNDSMNWLKTFISKAGLDALVDDAWYQQMCDTLVPPQEVDLMAHKRRVTPGNWKDVFDANLEALMRDRIGPEMEELHYHW